MRLTHSLLTHIVSLVFLLCFAGCWTRVTEPGVARDYLEGISIRPEDRCSPYFSEDYSYPQSVEPAITEQQGGLFSPYSMQCFNSHRDVDIEHVVARSEAHDSGMCAAPDSVRKAFARDLINLAHAAPILNRLEKSQKDAAEWLPDYNRCWYASQIIDVKRKYELSVDIKEAFVLNWILNGCISTEMKIPDCVSE